MNLDNLPKPTFIVLVDDNDRVVAMPSDSDLRKAKSLVFRSVASKTRLFLQLAFVGRGFDKDFQMALDQYREQRSLLNRYSPKP